AIHTSLMTKRTNGPTTGFDAVWMARRFTGMDWKSLNSQSEPGVELLTKSRSIFRMRAVAISISGQFISTGDMTTGRRRKPVGGMASSKLRPSNSLKWGLLRARLYIGLIVSPAPTQMISRSTLNIKSTEDLGNPFLVTEILLLWKEARRAPKSPREMI